MTDPLGRPGRAFVRYMTATTPCVLLTVFALLPPLLAFGGCDGVVAFVSSVYAGMAGGVLVAVCRTGASRLPAHGGRRVCLAILEGVFWGGVLLVVPALALDGAWWSGHAALTGPADERRAFAVVAIVCGVLGLAAALNCYTFLRSRLWADFRAHALRA